MQKSFNTVALKILIVLISAVKLLLINKGFLAFYDERRYYASGKILESLYEGSFADALQYLFSTQGRPGYTLLSLIPTTLQFVSAQLLGYEIYESNNAWPLFLYNFVVYICILSLHYKISLWFLKDRSYALLSVLIFSCLAASHISLRHADPYDASLLILYYVLYAIIRMPDPSYSSRRMIFLGFLAFFGFSCYPGYVLLFLLLPGMLAARWLFTNTSILSLKPLLLFGIGSAACLGGYEMLALTVGESYLMASFHLSTSITQGDFHDSFLFLFRYLVEAEQFTGLLLIIGIALFSLHLIRKTPSPAAITQLGQLFLCCLLLFLAYAVYGYYFEKVVWYARLIKQFIPVMVIVFVFSLQLVFQFLNSSRLIRITCVGAIGFLCTFNFLYSFREYLSYYYPKDVAWEFYNKYRFNSASVLYEYKHSIPEMPMLPSVTIKPLATNTDGWLFVNICEVYPFDDAYNFVRLHPKGYKQLFSGTYALAYKPYQYEAYNIRARKNIDSLKMTIRVYR